MAGLVAAMPGVVLILLLLLMVLPPSGGDFPATSLCDRARKPCERVALGGLCSVASVVVRGARPQSSRGWCSR
jgi:hypothetical protein